MHKLKKSQIYKDHEEVKDVFTLLEKNMNCTNTIIDQIDYLLERKHLPDSILKILTSLRNTCAVNIMNIARLTQ